MSDVLNSVSMKSTPSLVVMWFSDDSIPARQLSGPALALQGHEVPGPAGPGLVGLAKSRGPAGPGLGRARGKSRP